MDIEKIIVDINGERIDKFISDKLNISRSRVQKLIEDGNITIDGKIAKSANKVESGQVIMVEIPELIPLEVKAEEIPLDILYEDDDVIVVNKPTGMTSQDGDIHPKDSSLA